LVRWWFKRGLVMVSVATKVAGKGGVAGWLGCLLTRCLPHRCFIAADKISSPPFVGVFTNEY